MNRACRESSTTASSRGSSVAALGPIVQRVADQGDAVAGRILEHAAEELVLAARSVATRLEMRGDAFTFYLAGGVFRVVPWLVEELQRRLLEVAPRAQVQMLRRGAGRRRGVARARRSARRRACAELQVMRRHESSRPPALSPARWLPTSRAR